jgi:hypothetical protein
MRKNFAVLAGLGAAGLLLSGGGVGGVTNTPNSPAPAAASAAAPAATTPAATTPAPAKVGDSITLKGNTPGFRALDME